MSRPIDILRRMWPGEWTYDQSWGYWLESRGRVVMRTCRGWWVSDGTNEAEKRTLHAAVMAAWRW